GRRRRARSGARRTSPVARTPPSAWRSRRRRCPAASRAAPDSRARTTARPAPRAPGTHAFGHVPPAVSSIRGFVAPADAVPYAVASEPGPRGLTCAQAPAYATGDDPSRPRLSARPLRRAEGYGRIGWRVSPELPPGEEQVPGRGPRTQATAPG